MMYSPSVAHYHGQTFNASEIGKSLGVADTTTARYLDILAGTFMVRCLVPWFENLRKRQVKAPKIYFRDSGLLHQLLGVEGMASLVVHPKLGASLRVLFRSVRGRASGPCGFLRMPTLSFPLISSALDGGAGDGLITRRFS